MKKLFCFLVLIAGTLQAQVTTSPSVATPTTRTENVRNQFSHFTGSASIDTISTVAGRVQYVSVIVVNTAVASDSIYVYQTTNTGAKYLGRYLIPATPAPAHFAIPINVQIDSSYVVVRRFKTSDVSVGWRTLY